MSCFLCKSFCRLSFVVSNQSLSVYLPCESNALARALADNRLGVFCMGNAQSQRALRLIAHVGLATAYIRLNNEMLTMKYPIDIQNFGSLRQKALRTEILRNK